MLIALLFASPIGISSFPGLHSTSAAWAFQTHNQIHIDVRIVSNNNRTFVLEVPPLTVVDCNGGPTDLIFGLIGSPHAKFPADAGTGINVVNGNGEFKTPISAGDRTIVVTDRCTTLGEFKYDVGVVDPNGNLVILDPVIKNQ